jgi:ribose 5-phosphate isomerase B
MEIKSIGIASDHAGYELKKTVNQLLADKGYRVDDYGTGSADSVDYPDFAHKLAEAVESGRNTIGFSLCGSGNGISMTANKHQGIRSAICWNREISAYARKHNDANICALPARFISEEEAKQVVTTFLSTEFDGGRHKRRVEKIPYC